MTQELEQLRKAFEEHKQQTKTKETNPDDSMTTSQRQAFDQAEQLQKALQPVVEQLTEIGDEVLMQLAPGQFFKITKCDGAEYEEESGSENEA